MNIAFVPLAVRLVFAATLLCLVGSSALQATPFPGPDPAGYSATRIDGNLRDIRKTGTPVALGDEQVTGPIPLPFPFRFYDADYQAIYISSNGFVSFQAVQAGCCGKPLPDTDSFDNLIAAFWEDLDAREGRVLYQTLDEAPAREFVVGFYEVPHFGGGPKVTFEIILSEATGDIELQYGIESELEDLSARSDGGTHTVGIENAGGTIGLEIAHGDVSFENVGFLITHHAPTATITMVNTAVCPVQVGMEISDDQGHPLTGEVQAYSVVNDYPDGLTEIRLEMRHVSCNGPQPRMTLALGSTVIATFEATAPPTDCTTGLCPSPAVETFAYTDPAALAAWSGGNASNVFTLTRTPNEVGVPSGFTPLAWARVVLSGHGQPDRSYCLVGMCDAVNFCGGGFQIGDFQLVQHIEPALLLVPKSTTWYTNSTLPASVSLDGMIGTEGVLELIATESITPGHEVRTSARLPFERPTGCSLVAINLFNSAPTALCQNVTVPAGAGACTATASIDAGSFDPDGAKTVTLTQSPPGPYALGFTPVTLTATDSDRATHSCHATVEVVDATGPVVPSASATPNLLWPPNNRMVPVTISASLADACAGGGRCTIASVQSNEPSGRDPDWEITGALTLNLRAQRVGGGPGRVYSVNLRCEDASGHETLRTVQVTVPRSRGSR